MHNYLKSHYTLGGWLPFCLGKSPEQVSTDSEPIDHHQRHMHSALTTAMQGLHLAYPNPTVGCTVVDKEGNVLARAATDNFGGAHAEAKALQACTGKDAYALYTTLEPCNHVGKQGPCTQAIIKAGIREVYYGAADPNPHVCGGGAAELRSHGVKVVHGPLTNECAAWHLAFILYQLKQAPVVMAKWAQTIDGHMADDQGHSQWITGEPMRRYTHWLRHRSDAIMVGAATVLHDVPRLTARLQEYPGLKQPLKIIFDPSGRLHQVGEVAAAKLKAATFANEARLVYCGPVGAHSILPITQDPHQFFQIHLSSKDGFSSHWSKVTSCMQGESFLQWYGKPVHTLLVEGGPRLINQLFSSGYVDCYHAMIAPMILGGDKNRLGAFERQASLNNVREGWLPLGQHHIGQDILIENVKKFDRHQDFFL